MDPSIDALKIEKILFKKEENIRISKIVIIVNYWNVTKTFLFLEFNSYWEIKEIMNSCTTISTIRSSNDALKIEKRKKEENFKNCNNSKLTFLKQDFFFLNSIYCYVKV